MIGEGFVTRRRNLVFFFCFCLGLWVVEIGKGVGEEEESRWCFFSNRCKRVLCVFQDRLELPHDVLGSHDTLRHGLPALKNEALPMHPVEVIQNTVGSIRLFFIFLNCFF
jgi:hypothetical protein